LCGGNLIGSPLVSLISNTNSFRLGMPYQSEENEQVLVSECLKGNALYQKQLFEKYYGKMLTTCIRYTKDRDDAQDVLQDGMVKVFVNLSKFNFTCPLEAWIKRVIVNTAIDFYRKKSNQPFFEELDAVSELIDDSSILSDLNHAELLSLLNKLPNGYRIVFNMFAIEGYNHKEIAEQLNITEGTSKSQLSKAKQYLQKLINKELPHVEN